ncbi:hypothetical protein Tco_0217743 [Tanacetum coccineum]
MSTLKFADTHNMVAFLSKPTESDGFEQIVDFLNAHPIRKPTRKDAQVPQPSDPIENVADEAVHKELGESLVRAATTASSLETKQDSGGGPRCQETIGDTTAQTRFESVSKHFNDSLLARGNTLQSDEDSLKLNELMALFSLAARVESSNNEESLGEDASKQERIDAINEVEKITLVNIHDMDVSAGGDTFSAASVATNVSDATIVSAATNGSAATTTTTATITNVDDVTLAQALKEMKNTKPKQKGVVLQELDQIRLDEEIALKLQAAFNEEERLTREKVGKVEEANIALIETWDDIQAKIDVDHQLAERMQAQEQEELSIEENATLFQQFLEKKRKHFAAKRA